MLSDIKQDNLYTVLKDITTPLLPNEMKYNFNSETNKQSANKEPILDNIFKGNNRLYLTYCKTITHSHRE